MAGTISPQRNAQPWNFYWTVKLTDFTLLISIVQSNAVPDSHLLSGRNLLYEDKKKFSKKWRYRQVIFNKRYFIDNKNSQLTI